MQQRGVADAPSFPFSEQPACKHATRDWNASALDADRVARAGAPVRRRFHPMPQFEHVETAQQPCILDADRVARAGAPVWRWLGGARDAAAAHRQQRRPTRQRHPAGGCTQGRCICISYSSCSCIPKGCHDETVTGLQSSRLSPACKVRGQMHLASSLVSFSQLPPPSNERPLSSRD